MQLTRLLLATAVLLTAGAVALPADAQQRPRQQAQPPAPPPAPEPPPPPQMGPTAFALVHTIENRTQTPVEILIRMDGAQVFTGKLAGVAEKPLEGEEPPTVRAGMTLPVDKEGTTHFWEIIYTAVPDETAVRRANGNANQPAPPKTCRQAWTGVFSPGASQPQLVAPPQQVNKSGQCDYQIAVTPGEVYDIEVQLASAPR